MSSPFKRFFVGFKRNLFQLRASLSVLKTGWFEEDKREFLKQMGDDKSFTLSNDFPMVYDKGAEAGDLPGHYFYQDLDVAQRIFRNKPERHIDIGSKINGFVAHVATFRSIEVLDIRTLDKEISNVKFVQADLMELPESLIACCDSISSLHTIEHFGLGRYGDTIDYYGHLKALDNIFNMLKPGGKFYFSTPIGTQRVEFNAHRIFSINYLKELFEENYHIDDFAYENDHGEFFANVNIGCHEASTNFGCNYGCGIFELTKKER